MRTGILTLSAALLLAGCGGTEPEPQIVNPETLNRINSLSDCAELQKEFDTAEEYGHLHYMEPAHERMQEIGCYGE